MTPFMKPNGRRSISFTTSGGLKLPAPVVGKPMMTFMGGALKYQGPIPERASTAHIFLNEDACNGELTDVVVADRRHVSGQHITKMRDFTLSLNIELGASHG